MTTEPGVPVRVISTSWPVPGWTEPALVLTVPDTLASLALVLELDPTWVSPLSPICEQVVTFPLSVAVARGSEALSAQAGVLEHASKLATNNVPPLPITQARVREV